MNDNTQPEALRLANVCSNFTRYSMDAHLIAAELRRQHTRIAELEAQLEASGFDAADMATASAQGFRDGAASAMAGAPMAWMTFTEEGDPDMVFLDRLEACQYCEDDDPPKPLYIAATPAAQAEGWMATAQHQTYRCKIKSRKQIDKEIPRDQQGWWAVVAGQKLLLRPAVQADIDRCHLGPCRSKNPDDYMCETQTDGSLVSKIALEYMHPEENVFAAVPPPPTSAEGAEHG